MSEGLRVTGTLPGSPPARSDTAPARVLLLGPLEVYDADGAAVEVPGQRLRRLLVRLAFDAGRTVGASTLIDAVWADEMPAKALNALQSLVSRLRRLLPDLVSFEPAGYRLALSREGVDTGRFAALVTRGLALLPAEPTGAADVLGEALALWRGEPLPDLAGADFVAAELAGLLDQRLAVAEARYDALLRTGRADGALVTAIGDLADAHPLRERLHALRFRALQAAGRPAEALAGYEALRARLADELGTAPSAELRALHLSILRGEPDEARPHAGPRTPAPAPVEPAPVARRPAAALSSFVGRTDELDSVTALVNSHRLVTLTGPGGAGKTRLSAELAHRLPGDVWQIEFAPVTEPGRLPDVVLGALGLHDAGNLRSRNRDTTPAVDRLAAALADRDCLLMFDNCEHLVAGAAALTDTLLARCPRLRVLATSREPLGITGEALYPVPPLGLPDPADDIPDADTAEQHAAIRLFADRARAVRPSFRLDSRTTPAVVRLCRALDGLPLAIELAAARLRVLSVDQLADRLGDRFRLLSGGNRVALPRHQTLRAVIDWSWDLLSGSERTLLRRLAVFAGDSGAESVEAVCADAAGTRAAADTGPDPGRLSADEVFSVLSALVDKSLVVAQVDETHGEARYRLLETVRVYAAERLREAGEADAVRTAHAEHFTAAAEGLDPLLRGREQLAALARLDQEHDNLLAALDHAVATRATTLAHRLVASLCWYWLIRGLRTEGIDFGTRTLELTGEVPDLLRATVLSGVGMIGFDGAFTIEPLLPRLREAEALYLRASGGLPEDAFPEHGHPLAGMMPMMLAVIDRDFDQAMRLTDDPDRRPTTWAAAMRRMMRGHLLANGGQVAAARAAFREAHDAFERLGERWGRAGTLISLAEFTADDPDQVLHTLGAAKPLLLELGDRAVAIAAMTRLCRAHAARGDATAARAELATARQAVRHTGLGNGEIRSLVSAAGADLARWFPEGGPLDDSRAELDAVLAGIPTGQAIPPDPSLALVHIARGHLARHDGDTTSAYSWYERALRCAASAQDMPTVARTVELLAAIQADADTADGALLAARTLGHATALRGMHDPHDPDVLRTRRRGHEVIEAAEFEAAYLAAAEESREATLTALLAAVDA